MHSLIWYRKSTDPKHRRHYCTPVFFCFFSICSLTRVNICFINTMSVSSIWSMYSFNFTFITSVIYPSPLSPFITVVIVYMTIIVIVIYICNICLKIETCFSCCTLTHTDPRLQHSVLLQILPVHPTALSFPHSGCGITSPWNSLRMVIYDLALYAFFP